MTDVRRDSPVCGGNMLRALPVISRLMLGIVLVAIAACGEVLPTEASAQDAVRTVEVGGASRRYRIHYPTGYRSDLRPPVVLAFHGGGGNPESMAALSELDAASDRHGFLLVYPYGSGIQPDRQLSFNGGGCCAYAMQQQVDDVAFTRALLDDLMRVAPYDPDRVHATGLSNGGIMSHFLASELADRIASVASVGGPLMIEVPRPVRPIGVLHIHGTADAFAPYTGGYGQGAQGGTGVTNFRSVAATIGAWRTANACGSDSTVAPLADAAADGMRSTRVVWRCAGGVEVQQITVTGGGHTWPGRPPLEPMLGPATLDFDANEVIWTFFAQHPRRPAGALSPMRVLRTPEAAFAQLPGYSFAPHYVTVPAGDGSSLRVHYLDEGPRGAPSVVLLHGNPTWSYQFRHVIPGLTAAGYRVIAIDYVGMGRSDKPADPTAYTYDRHLEWLRTAMEVIDATAPLGRAVIVGHDYGVPLGIRLMAEHLPRRFDGFVAVNASVPLGDGLAPTHARWREFVRRNPDVPVGAVVSSQVAPALSLAEIAAYDAPYPDASYKVAIRTFPEMVPEHPDEAEARANQRAWQWLAGFDRPFLTVFGRYGAADPDGARARFLRHVPGAHGREHPLLPASHYVPEDAPDELVAVLLPFLEEVLGGSGLGR